MLLKINKITKRAFYHSKSKITHTIIQVSLVSKEWSNKLLNYQDYFSFLKKLQSINIHGSLNNKLTLVNKLLIEKLNKETPKLCDYTTFHCSRIMNSQISI